MSEDILARLAANAEAQIEIPKRLRREQVALVAEARQAGIEWTVIAEAIGKQRSHTSARFSPLLDVTVDRKVNVRPDIDV